MAEVVDLTAEYILNDEKKALEMAVHVYKAMPTVHERIIGRIWEGVLANVKERRDAIRGVLYDDPYYGIVLWNEGGTYCIYAGSEKVLTKGEIYGPVFGVYVYHDDRKDVNREQLQALVDYFKTAANEIGLTELPGTDRCCGIELPRVNVGKRYLRWGSGQHQDCVPSRWGDFLVEVVEHRNEIELSLTALLLRTYDLVNEKLL